MKKPALVGVLVTATLAPIVSALPGISRPDFEIIPRSPFESLSSLSPGASLSDPPVPFSITVNFSGDAAFQAAFDDAAAYWESLIPFYIDGNAGIDTFPGLTIDASVSPIDGPGGTLGSAGPEFGGFDDSGFLLATAGSMNFDSADFSSPGGSFPDVILHEMAHVIGIGTLWADNGLYDPNAASVSDPNNSQTVGEYTGTFGLLGWQAEFDADADFVPVEKGGGPGTEDGHWNEGDLGLPTGYVSSITGLDSSLELMTGWLNPASFVGEVTKGSLRDLGYEVEVVPETSAWLAGTLFGTALLLRRRRHGLGSR